jgi:pimeloyl-ACP methyl ester carboxylesterase
MRGDLCGGPVAALLRSDATRALTYAALGDWDWRDDFAHVDAPVLLIHGSAEPIPRASTEEWVAAFPNAQLEIIDGAGHYPHFERPDVFFRAVRDFLR